MKKAFLLLCVMIMLCNISDGQWLQRKYNVTDINQLSKEQLQDAYRKTKTKVWTGAAFTYIGTMNLLLGASIKTTTKSTRGPEGEGQAYKQAFLVMGTAFEAIGLPLLLTNSQRLKSIKHAMRNTEISLYPAILPNNSLSWESMLTPVLTVRINF